MRSVVDLKRAILLRKDSTFSEGDYGFRTFTEAMRNLADRKVVIALGLQCESTATPRS